MNFRTASMRDLAMACMALGLLSLVPACTGTFESRPPTLLVVAFEDADGPAVGLVNDTFNVLEPGDTRDLVFVPGSRRGLAGPAVAVDVVDRTGARPTAVFLTREPVTHVTHLQGFTIEGIDPDSPDVFQLAAPRYDHLLANGGPDGNEGLLERGLIDDYCPTELQMSSSGRWAVVFEERSACGGTAFRGIYVIDLDLADNPGTDPVVERIVSPEPGRAGMYLDQDGGLDSDNRETLYFIDPAAGVRAYELASGTTAVLDIAGLSGAAEGLRDIGRILDLLVLVDDARLLLVDLTLDAPTAVAVESDTGLTELVQDPFAITPQAVLFADDTLVVHLDANEPDFVEENTVPPRTDASLEPIDRFVYLLGDARIDVFDLLEFDGERVRPTPFPVDAIPNASVLTWTRALAEAAP